MVYVIVKLMMTTVVMLVTILAMNVKAMEKNNVPFVKVAEAKPNILLNIVLISKKILVETIKKISPTGKKIFGLQKHANPIVLFMNINNVKQMMMNKNVMFVVVILISIAIFFQQE